MLVVQKSCKGRNGEAGKKWCSLNDSLVQRSSYDRQR